MRSLNTLICENNQQTVISYVYLYIKIIIISSPPFYFTTFVRSINGKEKAQKQNIDFISANHYKHTFVIKIMILSFDISDVSSSLWYYRFFSYLFMVRKLYTAVTISCLLHCIYIKKIGTILIF